MHGIVLKRLGHSVHILNREQSGQLQTQGAGIGTTDSVKDFCDAYDLLDGEFWSLVRTSNSGPQRLR